MQRLYRCFTPAVASLHSRNLNANTIARVGYKAITMAPKRKRSSLAALKQEVSLPAPLSSTFPPKRKAPSRANSKAATNPDRNPQVLDGPNATRASPDSDVNEDLLLNLPVEPAEPAKKKRATAAKKKADAPKPEPTPKAAATKEDAGAPGLGDPEAEGEEVADEEELKEALSRPPPVHSDYLPLPWKGRLGYVGRLLPPRLHHF